MRAELESMISRIEAHFKKEQAARKRAEEQLAAAAADRGALAAQLEGERAQQARRGGLAPCLELQHACHGMAAAPACGSWRSACLHALRAPSPPALQAALLQQAMQERGMAEEGLRAELEAARRGALGYVQAVSYRLADGLGLRMHAHCRLAVRQRSWEASRHMTARRAPDGARPCHPRCPMRCRQELSARSEAMSAELASLRVNADAAARELEEQARELAGRWQQLAGRLHAGAAAGGAEQCCPGLGAAGIGPSKGRGQGGQQALHFHRSPAAAGGAGRAGGASRTSGGSPGAGARDPGLGAGERSLPRLPAKKTQAVFGAQLRQPGEAAAVGSGGGVTLPVLCGGGAAGRQQHERSSGVAWSSQSDRYSESKRDAGMVAHMATRWNRG